MNYTTSVYPPKSSFTRSLGMCQDLRCFPVPYFGDVPSGHVDLVLQVSAPGWWFLQAADVGIRPLTGLHARPTDSCEGKGSEAGRQADNHHFPRRGANFMSNVSGHTERKSMDVSPGANQTRLSGRHLRDSLELPDGGHRNRRARDESLHFGTKII